MTAEASSFLPNGWARTTLEQLGEWTSGGTPSKKHADYHGGSVPWVRTGDLKDSLSLKDIPGRITEEGVRNSAAKLFPERTLLMAMYGATIGKLATLGCEAATNQACAALLPVGMTSNIIPFLFYRLMADRQIFVEIGQGGAQPNISQALIKKHVINLPPLNEQRRIVAKIEALMARSGRAKEALGAIPALLDRYRRSVLAAAFRGDLTADWRAHHPDVEPASKLLERIREQRRLLHDQANRGGRSKGYEEPSIPTGHTAPIGVFGDVKTRGWSAAPLELLCDPRRGVPYGIILTGPDTAAGVPTVRCGDIKRFGIDIKGLKRVDPDVANAYQRTELQGGEVLIAVRGTVGATSVVPPEMKGMNISREVAMIPLLDGILARYVMFVLACPVGQAVLMGHVKGVAQSGINLSDLRSFLVPLPPQVEQAEMVRLIDEAFEKIDLVAEAAKDATGSLPTLNQSILAKAFRGELVPQDPNDEPASAFLARVQAERAATGAAPRRGRRRKPAPSPPA